MAKGKISRGINKEIRVGSIDEKYIGQEPTWKDMADIDSAKLEGRIVEAYNWYNYMITEKDKNSVVAAYLLHINAPKNKISAINQVEAWKIPGHIAALCRMFMRGFIAETDRMDRFNSKLNELIEYGNSIIEQKKKIEIAKSSGPVLSIQDYIRQAVNNHIADLEEKLDEFTESYSSEFNCYDWLSSKQIKSAIAQRISEFYFPKMVEVRAAMAKEDADLVEGYSHLSKKQMNSLYDFLHMIVKDCETWSDNAKASRKPRKKREKSIDKQIKNVKYQKEDTALKIVSLDPSKIIGVEEVWLFNTKYRTMQHYVAMDRAGIQVRGTTLQNYDEKKSMAKKIRKPEEFVDIIMNNGSKFIIKAFDKLKTKPIVPNGRMNETTLILRIIK